MIRACRPVCIFLLGALYLVVSGAAAGTLVATANVVAMSAGATQSAAVPVQTLYPTPVEAAVAGFTADYRAPFPAALELIYPCPDDIDSFAGTCFSFRETLTGTDAVALMGGYTACTNLRDPTAGPRCGGAALFSYVVHDPGGWRYIDSIITQNGGAPYVVAGDGAFANQNFIRTPGDCANVRSDPSLSATVLACLDDQTWIHPDDGPVYREGKLWWHIDGTLPGGPGAALHGDTQGWIAHELIGFPRASVHAG